jgi:signal peptidase
MRLIARLINLLLGAFIALIAVTAVVDTVLPRAGHPVIIISGASMAPVIPLGALAIEDAATGAALAPGDVGTFRVATGSLVTHRVVRTVEREDGTWYEVKGDANASPDPTLLPAGSVAGRVLFSIPLLGYLVWFLHLPSGVIAVLTATLALYIAGFLLNAVDEQEPEDGPAPDTAEGPIRLPA